MDDAKKPKTQLLHELTALRQRVAALEAEDTARQQMESIEQQLAEIVPDALVIIDKDGAIAMVNSQTEQLFGYARSEMLGQPVEMLLPARFRATPIAPIVKGIVQTLRYGQWVLEAPSTGVARMARSFWLTSVSVPWRPQQAFG